MEVMTVREWYVSEYADDEAGLTLNANVSFIDLMGALLKGICIYSVLGGYADSIIRERVFVKMAEIYNVEYSKIYELWLKA